MEDINSWQAKFESCQYSDKLLGKITLLNKSVQNPADIQEVKKAIYYARKYHGSQMRQSGEPYYSHPIEVAFMTSDYLLKTSAIVTSILHDTIEDTELTYGMIKDIFGELVANQVMDLTRIKEDGRKISSAELVESLWLQKKYETLFIKQFDRLDNIRTVGVKTPEKIQKIVNETIQTFIVLAVYLEMPTVKQELIRLCYHTLGITPPFPFDYGTVLEDDSKHITNLTFQDEIDRIRSQYLAES